MAVDFEAIATHKIGPLPTVAWVGLGAAALVLLRYHGGATAAQTMGGVPSGAVANPTMQLLNPGQSVVTSGGGVSNNPSILSSLFGGKNFNEFFSALGPDATGVSVSEGNANISVAQQNSSAMLTALNNSNAYHLWETEIQGQNALSALNIQGAYNLWGQELGGYWADVLGLHSGTVLQPGQAYVPHTNNTGSGVVVTNNPVTNGNY